MYNLAISSKAVIHPAGNNFTFPLILTNQSLVTLVSLLRPCRLPITAKQSNYLLLISKTLLISHLSISTFTLCTFQEPVIYGDGSRRSPQDLICYLEGGVGKAFLLYCGVRRYTTTQGCQSFLLISKTGLIYS
jgi:hypothetical protein